jgi:hypothetical protein
MGRENWVKAGKYLTVFVVQGTGRYGVRKLGREETYSVFCQSGGDHRIAPLKPKSGLSGPPAVPRFPSRISLSPYFPPLNPDFGMRGALEGVCFALRRLWQ